MRRQLIWALISAFTLFMDNTNGQEAQQSSWYPIITLKFGFNYSEINGDFYDTYNNNSSFPRPLVFSEARWADFEAPGRYSILGAEAGVRIHDKISVGIAGQHYGSDETDELDYAGIIEFSNGETVEFPSITEQHQFKSKVTQVFAFFDYRLFGKMSLSPVVGLGLGFTFSSFEWNWNIDGTTISNNILVQPTDDQTFMNIDNEKNFAVQPRFRLEYSFPGSGFFNSVFLQTDYVFSKYDADYFETFRNLALDGQPFESLPQQFQTDAIRKLYDRYDVNAGGLS